MPRINDITGSIDESSYSPNMAHGKPMLVGNQKKIDMNKDGKITKEDFSMLRAKMAMPLKQWTLKWLKLWITIKVNP